MGSIGYDMPWLAPEVAAGAPWRTPQSPLRGLVYDKREPAKAGFAAERSHPGATSVAGAGVPNRCEHEEAMHMIDAQHPLGRWQPWNPYEVAAFFANLPVPWWIAGGWAIDLFLGRQTREHEDIDVQVLRRDQHAVHKLFGAWDMQAALPPPRDENWPFRSWRQDEVLDLTIHDIWCRPTSTQPWALQLMIDDTGDDWWLFRRAPAIARPLKLLGGVTTDGIPY